MKNISCITVAWNKLYKKELFSDIRFPNGRLHEDEFTTYKFLYLAGEVSWLDISLYYYYQNAEGIMHSNMSTGYQKSPLKCGD